MRRLFAVLAVLAALALPASAQDSATLVADRVEVRSTDVLVAEGNVEVLWRGTRLKAARILYDRAADRLTVVGPIVLTEGTASLSSPMRPSSRPTCARA